MQPVAVACMSHDEGYTTSSQSQGVTQPWSSSYIMVRGKRNAEGRAKLLLLPWATRQYLAADSPYPSIHLTGSIPVRIAITGAIHSNHERPRTFYVRSSHQVFLCRARRPRLQPKSCNPGKLDPTGAETEARWAIDRIERVQSASRLLHYRSIWKSQCESHEQEHEREGEMDKVDAVGIANLCVAGGFRNVGLRDLHQGDRDFDWLGYSCTCMLIYSIGGFANDTSPASLFYTPSMPSTTFPVHPEAGRLHPQLATRSSPASSMPA